jgi:hypothetical protein
MIKGCGGMDLSNFSFPRAESLNLTAENASITEVYSCFQQVN